MSNQKATTQETIENAKLQLSLLEELELLESEYSLITNEYLQRRRHLEERIAKLN